MFGQRTHHHPASSRKRAKDALLGGVSDFSQLAVMAAKESVNRAFESGLSDGILFERRLSEDPKTLEELSQTYSVSRERVRQIEVRAFEKVQAAVKSGMAKAISSMKSAPRALPAA